jgi:AmmeMemoRadiSam system protein B
MSNLRYPAVAGEFYPAEPNQLREEVTRFLDTDSSESESLSGEIMGLLSPHAGYFYSAPIAAAGYRQLRGQQFDNVVAIAPSHYEYFEGCTLFPGDYQTPLGIVPTNRELAAAFMAASPAIWESQQGHRQEHALEVQLPFLQVVLENFQLVPLVVGCQTFELAEDLATAVSAVLLQPPFNQQKTLLLSSSDLSHYYPVAIARQMDGILLQDLQNFEVARLSENLAAKKCQACGWATLISTMLITKNLGANSCRIVAYGTSGERNHHNERVVGYAAGVFYHQSSSKLKLQ